MEARLTSVPCVLCGNPVRLMECKINQLGEPVHQFCLAERLESAKRQKRDGGKASRRTGVDIINAVTLNLAAFFYF